MGRHKIGLIIPHPEDQKWDSVWKLFRTPNLNLPTLAALIPEDEWDIEIQDELVGPINFERDDDLVFITVTTVVAVRAYEVARLFRERGAKVVLGGIHPSTLPDEAQLHADAIVVGEGELTVPRLLKDFKKGKLQPRYVMPHMVEKWDERPPRWDLLPHGYMFRYALTATRGCNYRCTFCSIHLALGGGQYGFRKKPPADVVKLIEQMSGPMVMFWDDDLLSDPAYYERPLCGLKAAREKMDEPNERDLHRPPSRLAQNDQGSRMFGDVHGVGIDQSGLVEVGQQTKFGEAL